MLLTTSEAAELLSISVRHFQRRVSEGRIPAPVHIGGCVRWSRRVLEKWVEAGMPVPRPNCRRRIVG
jgi:excisionase family DNA binding protein